MDRYLCLHGHFYQPPRENPWLEAIEMQDSAYPYHDWNERVSAECYAPNARSRLLDSEGRIEAIVNNYSRISFNVGPTLLAWMEQHAPDVYAAILEADAESRLRFSGHGSALAQAYNHMILPLANRRDRETQIIWGIRDFRHRFGRDPEGMWLPETAADTETLDLLAASGIRFTILSPYQAAQIRPVGSRAWRDVRGGRVDPSTAYRVRLNQGRSIAVFFYDGPISRAIAFEDLLVRGENLANRLLSAYDDSRGWPQLSHVATDGETYGHHKRFGDMALAYALHCVESNSLARLTNYGEFLERHPPQWEARIVERSSWSCAHGVERWASDCGCNAGGGPGWRQHWRGPLRQALDWLRDEVAALYEKKAAPLLKNPWAARDDYISVILDRSAESAAAFLARHRARDLDEASTVRARQLLEMQRHALLMYTSCGWFFDELSGIETVQVMQYAARAIQLARETCGARLEEQFLDWLERTPSNVAEYGNGRRIYEKLVRPAMVDLPNVAAHYAVSSLFEENHPRSRVYGYDVEREEYRLLRSGRSRLGAGRLLVTSAVTGESARLTFGVLHMGDHNVIGGVRPFRGEKAYRQTLQDVSEAFQRAEFPDLIRAMDRSFGTRYSLSLLFRDEQRRIAGLLVDEAMTEAESLYKSFYRSHSTLLRRLSDLGIPLPRRFQIALDFTLSSELRSEISQQSPDVARVDELLDEARRNGIEVDPVEIEFALRRNIEAAARSWGRDASAPDQLETLARLVEVARRMSFPVNLWLAENFCHDAIASTLPSMQERAASGDLAAASWVARFRDLADDLRVRVP